MTGYYWIALLYFIAYSKAADPVFTTEPQAVTKLKGFQADFSCKISKVASPVYYWLKDGGNVTGGTVDGSSVAVLTITSVQFSDMGDYSCVAVDVQASRSWTSAKARLTVEGRADITQPPTAVSSHEGRSASFDCVAIGNPEPSISWTSPQGSAVSNSGRFEVGQNGTLRINNLRKSDAGLYVCTAHNSFGDTHASATLTVLDPPSAPVFTTTPQNITAKENARITFHCRATGVPTPSISWGKMTGQFPSDRSDEPSPGSLRIVDVKPSDQGLYVCAAANSEGTVAAQVYLRIEGYPRISTGPTDAVVIEKSSVLFSCDISGDPAPHVEWTTPDGTVYTLNSNPLGHIRVQANNSLLVSMVTSQSAGVYKCAAVNSVGKATQSAGLTVLTAPGFSSPLANVTQNINTSLRVECPAEGTPVPQVQWIFGAQVLATNSTLSIGFLRPQHQGWYTCRINNTRGTNQDSFYLLIQVPPQISTGPQNQTVAAGGTVVFPCHVTGDPVPTVTWYKSGNQLSSGGRVSILSNGTLMVGNVGSQDTGWYSCQASSAAGQDQERALLIVTGLPVFSVQPQDRRVAEFSAVVMSCRAQAADAPALTWFVEDADGRLQALPANVRLTSAGQTLEIASVTRGNMAVYVCKACNAAGCDQTKATLTVFFSPSFPSPPKPVGVLQGQTAVLTCQPEASPAAEITWRRPNGQTLPGTSSQQVVSNVQPGDTGDYSCRAVNNLGSSDANVHLSIDTKASITDFTSAPAFVNLVAVQCVVSGKPAPAVSWAVGDVTLPNKTAYSEYDVTHRQQLLVPPGSLLRRAFTCKAQNAHASEVRLARVPAPPASITATKIEETSVRISWSEPSPPEQLVLQYDVEMQRAGGNWTALRGAVDVAVLNIPGLEAFTPYRFRVRAANGLGRGNYNQPSQNVTTLEGAPSVPRSLKLQPQNASVVSATWYAPAELNGYPDNLKYVITIKKENFSAETTVRHVPGNASQHATLDALHADTQYQVTIRAGRRRNDGVERWSGESGPESVTTLQLVPLTPPLELVASSNGPHQIMVKWEPPPYSIIGYALHYRARDSTGPFSEVDMRGRLQTVHLIMNLDEDTQYEIKARMYSNTGIGPFSEPIIVRTEVDNFAALGAQSAGKSDSLALQAAIGGLLGALVLLLLILAYGCYRRMKATRSRQSFEIEERYQDPARRFVTGTPDRRRNSSAAESDGSVEGQYNIHVDDGDSIDLAMFAGGQNSRHEPSGAGAVAGSLRYLDPAELSFGEEPDDDGVKLESFSPKYSPMPPRKEETMYLELGPLTSRTASPSSDPSSNEDDREGSTDGAFENRLYASAEEASPSPSPQQFPVYAQVNKAAKSPGGDNAANGTVSQVPAGDMEEVPPLPSPLDEEPNANEPREELIADNELLSAGKDGGGGLGDRKDSFADWPAPPPPSLMDPTLASDDLDLAPARSRVASWADD